MNKCLDQPGLKHSSRTAHDRLLLQPSRRLPTTTIPNEDLHAAGEQNVDWPQVRSSWSWPCLWRTGPGFWRNCKNTSRGSLLSRQLLLAASASSSESLCTVVGSAVTTTCTSTGRMDCRRLTVDCLNMDWETLTGRGWRKTSAKKRDHRNRCHSVKEHC